MYIVLRCLQLCDQGFEFITTSDAEGYVANPDRNTSATMGDNEDQGTDELDSSYMRKWNHDRNQ